MHERALETIKQLQMSGKSGKSFPKCSCASIVYMEDYSVWSGLQIKINLLKKHQHFRCLKMEHVGCMNEENRILMMPRARESTPFYADFTQQRRE